ncbi:MAG: redoxin domain-containing protein [Anaerolineales bacterium]
MIGEPAPDLSFPDLVGRPHRLSDFRRRIVVVNFWAAKCSHVARVDQILSGLMQTWGDKVVWLSIACNPKESIELIRETAAQRGLPWVLLDRNQKAVELYGAITTPHLFVIDESGTIRYSGAVDDVTYRQPFATHHYLREAIEALMNGVEPNPDKTAPYGCNIVRV